MRRLVLMMLAFGVFACEPGNEAADAILNDTGPSVDAQIDNMDPGGAPIVEPPTSAAAVPYFEAGAGKTVLLAREQLIFSTTDDLIWWRDGLPQSLGDAAGELRGAVIVDGRVLIAGSEGLFSLNDDSELVRSPLDQVIDEVSDLRQVGDDLWLATPQGLQRWRLGELRVVHPGEMPDTDARLASDGKSLWVHSAGVVYAVREGSAWPTSTEITPTKIAVNQTVWGIDAVGLFTLDGARWVRIELPFLPTGIAAHPGAADLWLSTADNALWHYREGHLRARLELPDFSRITAGSDGSVWLTGADGLYRVYPGRFAQILGLPAGADIRVPTSIEIKPSNIDLVKTIQISVDEGANELVDGPPWLHMLDPEQLGQGAHTVMVTVEYQDGEQATAVLNFLVGNTAPPTWDDDIEPLSIDQCGLCHGEGAFAHPLMTSDAWRTEIEAILAAVRVGRMPLTPNPSLQPAQIRLIEGWKAAGMPETWP